MDQDEKSGFGFDRRSDSIATTGPGIPDDALAPGEHLLTPPTDEEVEAMARKLGAPIRRTADVE